MKYKKIMFMLVLAIFIFGAASVCASDVNDTVIASEDTSQLELSAGSELDADNLKTSEKNTILTQTNNDESMSGEIDSEVLGADIGTYSGLSEEIGSGGNIELIHDYYTYDSGSTIEISDDNSVIDGKGAVIDMAGSNKQAFDVSASGVIIKNLTIKNAKYNALGGAILFGRSGTVENCIFTNNSGTSSGGAVYFSNTGTVTNCTFVGNTASVDGGAVYFSNTGIVTNCNFINNKATGTAGEMGSSGDGGAVHFTGDGTVTNCNFTGNTATGDDGGAVHFTGDGTVTNCTFVGNTAGRSGGGAVYFSDTGIVTNCNFTNNKATGGSIYGGAIWIYSGTVTNCSFTNHSANYGGAVRMGSGSVENCNFTDNTATRDGGAIWIYSGTVTNCNFTNSSATGAGGAVYFYDNSEVTNCNFIYNVAKSSTLGGGAIFFMISGNVAKCNFTDNSASFGGAVLFGGKGNISNSNFTNNSASNGGGAINMASGSVENCNFTDNKATSSSGGSIWFTGNGDVINCIFTNNSATGDGGAVYFYEGATGRIINCNFTNNKVPGTNSWGGAIRMSSGTVSNCNFTNNTAIGDGGAVFFYDKGTVSNCNFTDNIASIGGAVYFDNSGTVSNCNFTDNTATRDGGAVYFSNTGSVSNCNFTNNTATGNGGAINIGYGTVTNCNFTNNKATGDYARGGAIFFVNTGTVTNCNFTDNTATYSGGAIRFQGECNVTNCNFTNNSARNGGAVVFDGTGNVTNCNFTNNTATSNGGAVYFYTGNVTNCNFADNTAAFGGAVFFDTGNVTNCNFADNTASLGGAVFFFSTGNVTNCNFTGNNATTGSAIYFYSTSATKTVSNSRFLNNRANAEALEITKNDNNITITFTGGNNLLNAIYSSNDAEVTFTNVTYWGANGITTVSATMSGSNKEEGQNITVGVVVNNELVLSDVMVTDENGMIVLDISAGENYYISARHNTDSYYTEAEKTISNNTKFNVNVTSQTTTNKTVNITAKSNIPNDVVQGKLLFILPNGTQIEATYGDNGTWWAEHTFDAYGEYKINATYVGLDNVTINNGTITINKVNSTITLDNIVLDYGETKNVTVTTTGATGITAKIDGNNVTVINNYTIQIPVLDAGTYNLTVTTIADKNHNNITKNATITVNKVNGTLTVNDVVLDYGETKNVTVTTTGATGITAKIDGNDVTVINNYTIQIPVLDAGTYNLTVTTIPDDDHNSVTKEVNITVNKVNSTLTVSDIVFDYGSSGSTVVSLAGAYGVNATVVGQPKTVVKVNGTNITVSDLDAGTYTLTVTTIADKNHNNITKNATITVNNVNSTLTLDDVVLDYGESKNITVTTEGAIGITAKIDGVNVTVNGYTIPISGLGAGNYTLTVKTIADENHNPVTKEAKITVNKVESTLNVGDIVFDYDGEGSGDVSFTGVSEVLANVVNQSSAVVSVSGNKIFVSGLAAGTYTLNVTTVPDENHTAVTETATITVNKINSTLTLDDVELDYGDSKNVTVATEGATSITAKIDGVNVTVNNYTILISELKAGNHTLSVTTIPDDNHNPVNVTSKIIVNKVESTLTVDDIVFDYGGEGSGDVSFTGASEVIANVVNQPSAVISISGNKITVSGLGAGTYTLNVTTVPDENHTAVTETATITVNKINSTLTLDDVELDYGDSKNVTVATEGATGITAKIDGVNVTVNGYTIPISGLGAGNYTLTVTTIADENHNPVTKEANITVNKVNATLTVNDVVLDYGESKNITVTTEGATGITAKIDGVNVTVNGYTIPISGLGAGNYTLTVTTIADENHNPVTKEANITVNKLSTEIILANETLDLKVGDEVPVLANLTPEGAGNLTFTSSNEDLVFVEDNVTIVANSQGQAIITVSFAGNENYTAAENKTITVNVELNDASASVENATLNLKVDETCAINATINPDTIMLHIKYTSSNESVATVDKNGIVTAVGEGRAIITLEVGDDEIYAKNSTTVTVTVSKINTTADVSIPENITVGDNSTVNVILPADATGNVTVKVDGEVVDTVPVKDGNADVTIPSMSAGNHTVEIAYSGDGKYNPVTETKDITVSKNDITPEIIIPSDIEFGDNATVDIKLPGDASGNVTLTVDGKEINTVPVTNGTASVKLPALDAGNHTAEIAYSGDDKYKSASKTTTISIDKDSTKITADDVTATYKVDKYLVITLKDSKGNPLANASVTVDLNTIKKYTTDENGQIKIKVSNLVPKTYNAKITFAGNNNYLGSDATAKVVVKKATPKITASNKMFKTTTKTKKYTITLKDNTGKPIRNAKVYLKVNGKTYKATTNSKGKATFKITKLSKTGTFKATVTYKGNKYFNKASKKVTVKVISAFKTISKGSKAKSTVKEIQRALKNNGYYLTAYGHYLKVDGIYWDYTVKAVKQFQKAKGLKITGKVDEKTAKKLGIL